MTIEKFTANYASANEALAARAKANISFSDYKEGSASATVKSYTDKLVDYANDLLARFPEQEQETLDKVQSTIDRYAAKLAEAIDKDNEITCRCPSVMITGGSNFPVRKKEKQNEAARAHWEKTHCLYQTDFRNPYFDRVRKDLMGSRVIRSDDPHAVEKIKAKIAALEAEADPYGNNKSEVRRLKERLLELSPDEMKQGKEITVNGEPATFENIVKIFNSFKPTKSNWADEERYYLGIPTVISDGKRKYKGMVSDEVNADATEISSLERVDGTYKTVWKPLTDRKKFYLIINQVSGSGNKAVVYSILKDLDPEVQAAKQKAESSEPAGNKQVTINGEVAEVVENTEIARLQILFDGKPSAETRSVLKSNGFRWAPSHNAWQRLLNGNARYALNSIIDK